MAGPSGSGKTTLLNLIGCLDTPSAGEIAIDGEPVTRLSPGRRADLRARKLGFVFQTFNLIPGAHRLGERRVPAADPPARGDVAARVKRPLEQVGLGDRRGIVPPELSGGQQQRVAIAAGSVGEPALVLADEPTANLDSQTGHEIIELMRRLNRERGTTFVFSTHDPRIMKVADRVLGHVRRTTPVMPARNPGGCRHDPDTSVRLRVLSVSPAVLDHIRAVALPSTPRRRGATWSPRAARRSTRERVDEAIDLFERAVAADAKNPAALAWLGNAQVRKAAERAAPWSCRLGQPRLRHPRRGGRALSRRVDRLSGARDDRRQSLPVMFSKTKVAVADLGTVVTMRRPTPQAVPDAVMAAVFLQPRPGREAQRPAGAGPRRRGTRAGQLYPSAPEAAGDRPRAEGPLTWRST